MSYHKKLFEGKIAGVEVGIAVNSWEYVLYVGNNQYYYGKMEYLLDALLGILMKKELMSSKKVYTDFKELMRDIKGITERLSREIEEAIKV